MKNISAERFVHKYKAGELTGVQLLDVREQEEWEAYHLPGGILIPLQQLPDEYTKMDPKKEVYVYCAHGVRSLLVAKFLINHGFEKVFNVEGGLAEVSLHLDESN